MGSSDTDSPRMLTADDIWAAQDIQEQTVDIPEWGGSVRIRELTLKQVSMIAKRATRRNPQTQQDEQDRELMAALTIVEGMIEPKITMADYGRLVERSARAVTRIVQAISSLGPTEDAVREADKSTGRQSDSGIRVLPSAGTQEDAGGTSTQYVG